MPEDPHRFTPDEVERLRSCRILVMSGMDFVQCSVPSSLQVPKRIQQFVSSLTEEELCYIVLGGYRGQESRSIVGAAGQRAAGAAGETVGLYEDRGLPVIVMAESCGLAAKPRLCP